MTSKIDVKAYREGKWWTFEIPELGSPSPSGAQMMPVGQARSAAKVADEARDLAALWTERDPEDFEVTVSFVLPDDVVTAQHAADEHEARGRAELAEAAQLRRQAVRTLLAENITGVDAATVLGLSRQRIQQLS